VNSDRWFAVTRYAGFVSPAARALEESAITQGSPTRPGLHAVARYAGFVSPAARALEESAITQGSPTRPGRHAVARYAGFGGIGDHPRLADSPWATCRPLRGLCVARYAGFGGIGDHPRARGLALGYMLSPATRVCLTREKILIIDSGIGGC